ncbi:MAG: NTP transferase domain-containing protein [Candidatus Acidiferrales bacterium]
MRRRGKIGVLVQARMGSKRLPGKALAEVRGKPLLQGLCNRMRLCRSADEVIVATSDQREDDAIAGACIAWGFPVFRGPAKDLTTRLLGAAKANNLDAFVRVTGDNPLTDPDGIDELIEAFLTIDRAGGSGPSLVHNMHTRGYPYGTGAEVASRSVLELCDLELRCVEERENFAQFAKRHPRQFACTKIDAPPHLLRPQYFLTVDYQEDLDLQGAIYRQFLGRDEISLNEIVAFLDANPALAKLNSHLHHQFPE